MLNTLSDPEIGHALITEAGRLSEREGLESQIQKLNRKLEGYREQGSALAEHLSKIPKGIDPSPIFTQMKKMEDLKEETKREINEKQKTAGVQELPASWREYKSFLKMIREVIPQIATPELRAKIIALLVHQVEVFPDRIKIHYYVGRSKTKIMKTEESGVHTPGSPPNVAKSKIHEGPGSFFSPPSSRASFSIFSGSNTLTNGRGDLSTDEQPYPFDKITHFKASKQGISKKCAEFYENGHSLKQISKITGIAKTSVRDALIRVGISTSSKPKVQEKENHLPASKAFGAAPYGYCWLQKSLVTDPREFRIVQLIVSLWTQGQSYNAIAKHLNIQKLKTRRGGRWDHSIVRSVVQRHKDHLIRT